MDVPLQISHHIKRLVQSLHYFILARPVALVRLAKRLFRFLLLYLRLAIQIDVEIVPSFLFWFGYLRNILLKLPRHRFLLQHIPLRQHQLLLIIITIALGMLLQTPLRPVHIRTASLLEHLSLRVLQRRPNRLVNDILDLFGVEGPAVTLHHYNLT